MIKEWVLQQQLPVMEVNLALCQAWWVENKRWGKIGKIISIKLLLKLWKMTKGFMEEMMENNFSQTIQI
jgi:hypothetical protein